MKINHIVFYGTLQSTQSTNKTMMHPIIEKSLKYVSSCIIPGQLYDHGRYPALVEGEYPIEGELYKIIDQKALTKLDEYEAVDSCNLKLPGFSRKSVKLLIPNLKAWVYYYDGPIDNLPAIASNCWL
jgi:gamma-glutamylcyclotransferase (GGCT)/AIG2-like uncharacterized protein YtfP